MCFLDETIWEGPQLETMRYVYMCIFFVMITVEVGRWRPGLCDTEVEGRCLEPAGVGTFTTLCGAYTSFVPQMQDLIDLQRLI